jgi:hypothetical protein
MAEVMRISPVHREEQAQHEQRHEEIILSNHDALLYSGSFYQEQHVTISCGMM